MLPKIRFIVPIFNIKRASDCLLFLTLSNHQIIMKSSFICLALIALLLSMHIEARSVPKKQITTSKMQVTMKKQFLFSKRHTTRKKSMGSKEMPKSFKKRSKTMEEKLAALKLKWQDCPDPLLTEGTKVPSQNNTQVNNGNQNSPPNSINN
ncbi:hypothetical protein BDB01DRAFT_56182 [Pilobolus umbonatus]|nr:hypothetical protein BDB01DRAFT_56182 [Pilobolus umbonatus]